MKCFNCGNETQDYLCPNCRQEEILDRLIPAMLYYREETCPFPGLAEYAQTVLDPRDIRLCVPNILALLPAELAEYYYCLYYRYEEKDKLISAIEQYLHQHHWEEKKSQNLIAYLVSAYLPNDFIKPRILCDWIAEAKEVFCELYARAAEYYAMIGDYDLSDQMVMKGLTCDRFLYSNKVSMHESLEKQKAKTQGYRTKKPYWPATEERQRVVAMFYDEKGISYPRIGSKPAKVPENEFAPINECFDTPKNFCAFWCSAAFSVVAVKPIYQIAAIKLENGFVISEFQSFIRPWEGGETCRKSAAKEIGVPLSVIDGAEDVDQVMAKFFDFVGDAVLVSTDALGAQKKLLCRAARYSGMKCLPNELYDLLDLAGETDSKFDFKNRTELLEMLGIAEGMDALGKAKANVALYNALTNYGA